MDIREKMRLDWDRRAKIDPRYWVAATEEADEKSYHLSAELDVEALLAGLDDRVPSTGRVLDLGCGIGRLAAKVAAHFDEVVGVDVSPTMIEVAQDLHQDIAGLRFEANSGADLANFETGHFDLVFSYSVLPHLPPDVVRAYFAEVSRILKPGAWFRYQFWIGPEAFQAANDTLSIRVWGEPDFKALNSEHGLEVHEITDIEYFDPVLKLHPVWVNAQKVGDGAPMVEPKAAVETDASQEERDLEYGLLLYLAVKHSERGERQAAEDVLQEALQTDPKRVEGYVQWASLRMAVDDQKGVWLILKTLTEEIPTSPVGWIYLAQVQESDDKFEDAWASVDRFDALNCDDDVLITEIDRLRARLPARKKPSRKKTRTRLKKT